MIATANPLITKLAPTNGRPGERDQQRAAESRNRAADDEDAHDVTPNWDAHQRRRVAVGRNRAQRPPPASPLDAIEGGSEQRQGGTDHEHASGEDANITHIPDNVERPRDVNRIRVPDPGDDVLQDEDQADRRQ